MRVVVIGGSGHIGTYLIPELVELGHDVINVTRGQRQPYVQHPAWAKVKRVEADREAEDRTGTFAGRIAGLAPDVVFDLISFTEDSARQMVEALRGRVQHYLHCGTIWVFGHSTHVPATEDLPKRPFGEYGIQKAAIEDYLLGQSCGPGTLLGRGMSRSIRRETLMRRYSRRWHAAKNWRFPTSVWRPCITSMPPTLHRDF